MAFTGLECDVADATVRDRAAGHLGRAGVVLPTFAQLAEPETIPREVAAGLAGLDPDAVHPLNLFRVHWYNDDERTARTPVPSHLVLPEALTGVAAPIVVATADTFPLIRAHKVLPAYGCLVPRLVSGRFDPTAQRAVWPSTGNYCRGGVAISRILGCRGVAVLPEGMSAERFRWLEEWVAEADDIIRTPGTESNVKEIYDTCAELARDPDAVVLNQFSEFANYLIHHLCTGGAMADIFEDLRARRGELTLAAFVAATGSAGTLAAGDSLKERYGSRVVAVEALECPTLLYAGFGEHNIQGIGDKHLPLIHNVMNTDLVAGVSDRSTDSLNVLFNTPVGRHFLRRRKGLDGSLVEGLGRLGLSAICNVLAAIKTARYLGLGPREAVLTVATDGAGMYASERDKTITAEFPDGFDALAAAETFGRHLAGVGTDHLAELSHLDRRRIFNLGYYTWVEQQGVEVGDFEARRDQGFWRRLHDLVPAWDAMIDDFNARARSG